MKIVRLPPTAVGLIDRLGRYNCCTVGRRRALEDVIAGKFDTWKYLPEAATRENEDTPIAGREGDSAQRSARDAECDAISRVSLFGGNSNLLRCLDHERLK
jgi:hypothetical protein